MANHTPDITEVELKTADQLWNFVLARQGLGSNDKFNSISDAASASLGLHSARLGSPLATLIARTHSHIGLAELTAVADASDLITVRCMRKTLHALPPDIAAIAHAATRGFRLRDTLRLAHNARLTSHEVEAMAEKIGSVLADQGELAPRAIEQLVTPTATTPLAARIALKLLWERGDVTYRNRSTAWDREVRMFSLKEHTYPAFVSDMDHEDAVRQLVKEYFHRYGPATVIDASWWSGISRARVSEALEHLQVVALRLPWVDSPCFMLQSDFEVFTRRRASQWTLPVGVCLLAHEDVALKAYFESRGRYLGHRPQSTIFNQIGEALPTVLLDGKAIGRWVWIPSSGRVEVRLFSSRAARGPLLTQLNAEVEQLEHRLRVDSARWSSRATN